MKSRHIILRAIALALLAGCASSGPHPGTGDVSFRLLWEGTADLDLHVEDPTGRHTGTFLPHDLQRAETGGDWTVDPRSSGAPVPESDLPDGILDIDCNGGPDRICPEPIENVYWPTGTAPDGTYRARVVLFQRLHSDALVPYRLEIRAGERVVRTIEGSLSDSARASGWAEHEFRRAPETVPVR